MTNVKLQITPQPSAEKLSQQFAFIGSVDVEAIPVLETLYALPTNCTIELNFAQLERINSMGLAQLLKLFEHWQKQNNSIKIVNVNRMITVLFKMTGLTRFLTDATAAPQVKPEPARPQATPPTTPVQPQAATTEPAPTTTIATSLDEQTPLKIQPQPSTETLIQKFDFIGQIDVNAIPALEALYVVPPKCQITLDFVQLQRINSMGLAQLLKLFEHWQKREISIRIINANRMIGVLFKMTGLTRFLSGETAAPTQQPVLRQETTLSQPANPAVASPNAVASTEAKTGKLTLWVSAQSSQQMNGWYFFNTYLQRHLDREVHLEIIHGAVNEQQQKSAEQMDIVFSKPFEATRLLLNNNYLPILRPIDQTDEVTLLVRSEDTRQGLAEFKGGKVVTAAADNFVYLLGRFLLEQDESELQNMDYIFSGHDIKALQMLLKGQADILFMLSETYRGLSGLTKKMLREIDQSETAFAFHLFSVAPSCKGLAEQFADVLLNMGMDSQGRQVLLDLGITGWIKPTPDEIDMLTMLFKRYAS